MRRAIFLSVASLFFVLVAPAPASAQNYCLHDLKSAGVLEINSAGKSNYLPCVDHDRPEMEASGRLRLIAKNLLGYEAVGNDKQPAS